MAERRCPVSEQIRRYVEAKADEIDGGVFLKIVFEVHHGALRRARIEKTDEFGAATTTERCLAQ